MVHFAPTTHHRLLPRWAIHLGMPGLFLVSALDSSLIPLPIPGTTDLLLLWLVSHNGNPWELASVAVAGSLVGGYTSWQLGRKGGEMALRRWVPARILDRIVRWVRQHPILAVFLPAILPPPIPLSPFLLASGALGVKRTHFLLSFGSARTIRYALVAWLAEVYGRRVVRLWSGELEKWSTPLLWIFAVTMVGGVAYGIFKFRSNSRLVPGQDRDLEVASIRAE
jgi:membrane protein YqaA with SNARE-associated domain